MPSELDRAISDLERTTLSLATSVSHRDPAFAGMIHARQEAALSLSRCDLASASTAHLARLRGVLLLGGQVERSIRQWRESAVKELGALGSQAEIARAGRNPNPAAAMLDVTI